MEERVGRTRLSRRRFLSGSAAVAGGGTLAAVLAACGGGSGSAGGGPRQGNAMMLLSEEQLLTRNFNPFVARPRAVTKAGMFEPLMIYNYANKKIVPWLATGYSWGNGDKTLSLKIRQGVRWSDGTKFTPDDVVFTFQLMKKFPGLLGAASGVWDTYLGDVTATGQGVDFHFQHVYSPGLYDLIHQLIVPKHLWSSVDDPVKYTNPDPVATGPFTKVATFEAQSMQVDRNPGYWQPGKPYIKSLHYSSSAGNQQLTQMLITDQLDWGGGYVPNIDKIYVDKDRKHHQYWWPLTHTVTLTVNHAHPPFDQLAVRKAFSLAMDRPQMVKSALEGHTEVANAAALPPFMYSDWIDKSVVASGADLMKRDVSQANKLLDGAGLTKGPDGIRRTPDGKPMKYVIQVPTGWTDWISDCEVAVGNFKDIGVQVSITTPAVDSWYGNVYTGQFDMAIGNTTAQATPFIPYRGLMGSFSYRPVGQSSEYNWHRYKNSQADGLLAQWAATADVGRQRELCGQLQKIFVDNLPVIPLYWQPEWGAYNTMRVTGFPSQSNPYAPLSNVASIPTYYIVMTTVQPAKSA